MPVSEYFKNSGEKVMSKLVGEYGKKKGTSVFYALSNKNPAMKPKGDK